MKRITTISLIAFLTMMTALADGQRKCRDLSIYCRRIKNRCNPNYFLYTRLIRMCMKTCGLCSDNDKASEVSNLPAKGLERGSLPMKPITELLSLSTRRFPKYKTATSLATTVSTAALCKNSGKYLAIFCKYWEGKGLCNRGNKWFNFMNDHCAKTCQFC